MKTFILTLASTTLLSMSVQAEPLWSDNSVSVLYGSDYEFNKDVDTTTLTLEHVSGHSWGKLFYFIDRHNGGAFSETYAEFSPTYSLAKMDDGFISGINAAFTYEFTTVRGGQNLDNFLVGMGAGLRIPGLDFASATIFYADNNQAFGNSTDYQLTLVGGYTNGNFTIDGFMDLAFGSSVEGDLASPGGPKVGQTSMNLTPQITYNIGPMLGIKNKLKVGVEYSYWTNQFGVDANDQNAVSLLLKAHL
jgi:hypothetical protein